MHRDTKVISSCLLILITPVLILGGAFLGVASTGRNTPVPPLPLLVERALLGGLIGFFLSVALWLIFFVLAKK